MEGLTTVIRMFSDCGRNCFIYKLIKTTVCLCIGAVDSSKNKYF
jgi:hypothetical protein